MLGTRAAIAKAFGLDAATRPDRHFLVVRPRTHNSQIICMPC
jgi:hypothetical protein